MEHLGAVVVRSLLLVAVVGLHHLAMRKLFRRLRATPTSAPD